MKLHIVFHVFVLFSGAVKFFGVVAQADPLRVIPKYENTTNSLFENIVSEDPSIRCLCAETIAFIGAKPEGLKILNSNPDRLKRCVRVMAKMIMNPGEDDYIRSRTAASLSSMFDHCYQDVEVSMICEKLFRQIDQHPISYLFKLAQQPFSELRYCSLKLLAAVSRYSWAEQDFVLCAGKTFPKVMFLFFKHVYNISKSDILIQTTVSAYIFVLQ